MFPLIYFITTHPIFKTLKNICFLSILIIFSIIFSLKTSAQGNVLITPKRIVFNDSKRSEEINLANIGNDTATYAVSWVQNRMKADGSFERITAPDPGQIFADKYLRFFPRTVTLAPGESQTVKVQITKSNEMTEGEYRSHLYFRALPKETPLGEKEPVKDSGISVKIVPVFGISIPMIIRKGENTSKIDLSNVSFQMEKDTIPTINMTINREGNMSVYGDVWIDHMSLQGKETRVGILKGLSVYTPNMLRQVRVVLEKKDGVDYHTGTLHIVFSDPITLRLAQREIYLH
jgi:P pilus assembly chaperone PapD